MTEPSNPVITTIIPTYRRPQLLKRAIESVLKQTYPHFQVCVYDNASGDETASVVAEFMKSDPRVKYHCHAENIGARKNFQYGLERVETPFFSFLSDDDSLLPEFYETALDGFKNHPEAMFSATDVIHVDTQRNILRTSLEKWITGFYSPPDGLIAVLENGHPVWTGILFRKEVTEKVGLLDMDIWCLDLDYTLRIAAHYPFVVSKHFCAVFDSSTAWGKAMSFELKWLGYWKMIQNLTEDKSLHVDVRDYAERVLLAKFETNLFSSGGLYLFRGNTFDAKKVALLLRDRFFRYKRYIILSAIINIYNHVLFARSAFRFLIICRRCLYLPARIKNKWYRNQRYRNLKHYLN